MCKCVWLTIAVVCVCSLGEEYVSGCGHVCVWVSGGGGQDRYLFCCGNLYYGFFSIQCLFIILNLNAFDVALMFFFSCSF